MFSSTRGLINELHRLCTLFAGICCRFPAVVVLNQPIARQGGGKASFVIGSRESVSEPDAAAGRTQTTARTCLLINLVNSANSAKRTGTR